MAHSIYTLKLHLRGITFPYEGRRQEPKAEPKPEPAPEAPAPAPAAAENWPGGI
jgi:hypothetical protein